MKYIVEETDGFDGVRVFDVREVNVPKWMAEQVWFSGGKVRCANCFGPQTAMLTTCVHAQAVKRFLAKEKRSMKEQE